MEIIVLNNINNPYLRQVYYNILCMLHVMLCQYGKALGLMVPGIPEQMALANGKEIDTYVNGQPLYRVLVKQYTRVYRSRQDFGNAVQNDLDATCYASVAGRLKLVKVDDTLPDNYIGLELIEGTW